MKKPRKLTKAEREKLEIELEDELEEASITEGEAIDMMMETFDQLDVDDEESCDRHFETVARVEAFEDYRRKCRLEARRANYKKKRAAEGKPYQPRSHA